MTNKYKVSSLVKYKYSDITKYVDKGYTNEPIRNDELVDLLNSQDQKIKELEKNIKELKKKIFRGE